MRFQVVQEERGAFTLKIVKGDQFSDAAYRELMTALREYIGETLSTSSSWTRSRS